MKIRYIFLFVIAFWLGHWDANHGAEAGYKAGVAMKRVFTHTEATDAYDLLYKRMASR